MWGGFFWKSISLNEIFIFWKLKISFTEIFHESWKSDSQLTKKFCYLLHWKPIKNDKKCFLFYLKTLFVLKIFKLLSWHFGHVGKTSLLERQGWLQNLWRHNLVNKQLQYTYWSISHELKGTRQCNLVN